MLSLLTRIMTTKRVTEPASSLKTADVETLGTQLNDVIRTLYGGRALRVRHVDAGSTNAEEYELTALNNAYYDIERFGLSFVASPRHADILTVSGPVTRNMEQALKSAYEMTPEPKLVVALGDGACDGGIWKGSYAIAGAVEDVIPVDVKIPGDPPSPTDILRGLLGALRKARS